MYNIIFLFPYNLKSCNVPTIHFLVQPLLINKAVEKNNYNNNVENFLLFFEDGPKSQKWIFLNIKGCILFAKIGEGNEICTLL
jgi:hypothetical protein